MMLLTEEQEESFESTKFYYVCKETFENKYVKNKKYFQFRDHYYCTKEYRGTIHSICNLKYMLLTKSTCRFS